VKTNTWVLFVAVASCTIVFSLRVAAQPPAIVPDKNSPELPSGVIARLGILRLPIGSPIGFAADGKTFMGVMNGEKNGFVIRYDAVTGKEVQRQVLAEKAIIREISADARFLLGGSLSEVSVFDSSTGRKMFSRPIPGGPRIDIKAHLSADGKTVVIAEQSDENKRLLTYDVATGAEKLVAEKLPVFFSYLYISANAKRLITFDFQMMRCWDAEQRRMDWQAKYRPHHLIFTPDNRAVLFFDRSSKKWLALDAGTGQAIDSFKLPKDDPYSVPFVASDNRTLVLPTKEGVILWDMKEGRERHRLPGTERNAASPLQFIFPSPDGKTVLSNLGGLQRWELETGRAMLPDTRDVGHTAAPATLAFSPDGKWLASGALEDHTIRIWDVTIKRLVHSLRGHTAYIRSVQFTPDSKRLISGSGDSTVRIWDVATGQPLHVCRLHDSDRREDEQQVCDFHLNPDGRQVNVLAIENFHPGDQQDNVLTVWDTTDGKRLDEKRNPFGKQHRNADRQLAWSHLTSTDNVLLWNGELLSPTTGKHCRPRIELGDGERAYSACLSEDERLIVAAIGKPRGQQTESDIGVWEVASGKLVLRAHMKGSYWDSRLSINRSNAYAASPAGVKVFDLYTGREVRSHRSASEARFPTQHAFAVSPDGRIAATGTSDSTILLWDVAPPHVALIQLKDGELAELWTKLAGPDAKVGFAAVARFVDHPTKALAFLKDRLKPAAAPPVDQVKALLADLDSPTFKTREAAEKKLHELGEQIVGSLQEALNASPTPEARNRIAALLEALAPTNMPKPEALRSIRAVWLLERIGTPEAKQFLQMLANGHESARLTHEAKAALARSP